MSLTGEHLCICAGTPATKAFTDLDRVARFVGHGKSSSILYQAKDAVRASSARPELPIFATKKRQDFAQLIHVLRQFMIRHTKAQRIAVRCRQYSLACHALQTLSRKPEPRFDGCRGNRR